MEVSECEELGGNMKTEIQLFCNCCKKQICVENGIAKEGILEFSVEWGYFSKKDGEIHSFDLCEDCYERIIASFEIPVKVVEKTELL